MGYGIVYPFGVVLFIQIIPELIHADMAAKARLLTQSYEGVQDGNQGDAQNAIVLNSSGFLSLMTAIVLGVLIGHVRVPLPGGARFSLGSTGGPLLTGLLFGHLGQICAVSL